MSGGGEFGFIYTFSFLFFFSFFFFYINILTMKKYNEHYLFLNIFPFETIHRKVCLKTGFIFII